MANQYYNAGNRLVKRSSDGRDEVVSEWQDRKQLENTVKHLNEQSRIGERMKSSEDKNNFMGLEIQKGCDIESIDPVYHNIFGGIDLPK